MFVSVLLSIEMFENQISFLYVFRQSGWVDRAWQWKHQLLVREANGWRIALAEWLVFWVLVFVHNWVWLNVVSVFETRVQKKSTEFHSLAYPSLDTLWHSNRDQGEANSKVGRPGLPDPITVDRTTELVFQRIFAVNFCICHNYCSILYYFVSSDVWLTCFMHNILSCLLTTTADVNLHTHNIYTHFR